MKTAATSRRKLTPLIAGAAACAIIGAIGVNQLTATDDPSCSTLPEGVLVESNEFTPFESRRSRLPDLPLNPRGVTPATVPVDARVPGDVLDGLGRQWTVVTQDAAVYQYFGRALIGADVTPSSFLSAGGVQYEREPAGTGSFAAYLLASAGDRAVSVAIGPHEGALVWADPRADGSRSHNLYWFDGTHNHAVIADRTAVEVVNIGRSIACDG